MPVDNLTKALPENIHCRVIMTVHLVSNLTGLDSNNHENRLLFVSTETTSLASLFSK